MSIFREQMQEILNKFKKDFQKVNNELDFAPRGNLIYCKVNGKPCYLKKLTIDGSTSRKSIHSNVDEIKSYARKAYILKANQIIESNIATLEKAMKKIKDYSPEAMLKELPNAYQNLPIEYFYKTLNSAEDCDEINETDSLKKHAEWARAEYEKSEMYPEYLIHRTSLGFNVRSKSELLIIEQLIDYGVIPRYEQVLYLGHKTLTPDFTFIDRDGNEFYWEHAGRMDDERYQVNHKRKMQVYETIGIVPWRNLIVTYDIDGHLNLPMIKSIIEHEVIPRIC